MKEVKEGGQGKKEEMKEGRKVGRKECRRKVK